MPDAQHPDRPPIAGRHRGWLDGFRSSVLSLRWEQTATRTLYIHAGGPKAGSSKIQSFLSAEAANLDRLGVAYRNAPRPECPNEITSGNGQKLFGLFTLNRAGHGACDQCIEGFFDANKVAICSSELLAGFGAQQWRQIRDSCLRRGVKPLVIFLVRNAAAYLRSNYQQAIKRAGYHESFDVFLSQADYGHATALRTLWSVFQLEELRVLHFESVKPRIVAAFLEVIGLDAFGLGEEEQPRMINRGLAIEEELLLREANQICGDTHSAAMSDSLLSSFPNRKVAVGVSEAHHNAIEKKYANDVEWINNAFFRGQPVVSAAAGATNEEHRPVPEVFSETAHHLLLWAVRQLGAADEQAVQVLISKLSAQSVRPDSVMSENLPVDFEPLRYLLGNRDVLNSGWNAYEHYAAYGRHEGRMYREA